MNDKNKRTRWMHYRQGLMLVVILFLSGCAAKELSFEILDQGLGMGYYDNTDPDFFVITQLEDIETPELDVHFRPELVELLRAQDYQQQFIVVIFRGFLPVQSSSYAIEPRQILRDEEQVILKVHFGAPDPPDSPVRQAVSSPYLVLAVSKAEPWSKEIRFTLEVDGKEVKEHSFFIP